MVDSSTPLKVLCVIPARYGSTRFPGKPLAKINGREMILRVCDQVSRCLSLVGFLVATDDDRIYDLVKSAGFEALLTSDQHATGTDRLAEVASRRDEDYFLNLQGDEPLIDPQVLDDFVSVSLEQGAQYSLATLCSPISQIQEIQNPNIVKVVRDRSGKALYFSRAPIPFPRDGFECMESELGLRHVGIYLYPRDTLLSYTSLPHSTLELVEKLEQLRIMEDGGSIFVWKVKETWPGVDTPEDLKLVESLLKGENK